MTEMLLKMTLKHHNSNPLIFFFHINFIECLLLFSDYPTIMGFEPLVNQRLLPPTFPRYTVIKSREECVSYMETLLTQLHILPQITDMLSLHTILVSTCSQTSLQKHSSIIINQQHIFSEQSILFK